MKQFLATSIKKYFQLRNYQVELWKKNAQSSQEFIFFDLINTAKHTEFGIEHDFEQIQSLEDFQRNISIYTYEQIHPYIKKMIDGEEDILWPGKIMNFSKSSGTTNDASKYIPVSHASLYRGNYKAGKDLYSIFFNNYPESDLFKNNGAVFGLGGSFETNNQGIKIGDVSAIIMDQLPRWAESHREPSIEVALMSDWKDKIPAIIAGIKDKNITHLSGVPTWFVSIFEAIQKETSYSHLRDLWPNLELFIHGAVAFGPYRPLFDKLIPFDDMKYMEVYNASEGFIAIQDDPALVGEMLLLTDHGIFYEFIPMKEYGLTNATAIPLSQVKIGVDYAMIITTNAGLWRYDIGDTVCFTSTDPYRIKISGRTKHFINVFGEELMVGNTDTAIAQTSKELDVVVCHYTAGPIFMNEQGKGGHEWVIEFQNKPEDIEKFIQLLDTNIQVLNSDYKAKRQDNIALQQLKLNVVHKGTFMKWMEQRGKLGGQHKVPRLSNKRRYLKQLLDI
jgi:hypothetical protein